MSKHTKKSFEGKQGLKVEVRNGNFDTAMKLFSRKIKREGLINDIRKKEYYEKPSVVKRRKKAEAVSRWRKNPANPKNIEM